MLEVHFASSALEEGSFADIITECYAHLGESLKGLKVMSPPAELEEDLTDRNFEFVNRQGKTLKRLEPKEAFRKRHVSPEHPNGRSPDDGDGVALAAAPDFVFANRFEGKIAPALPAVGASVAPESPPAPGPPRSL